MTANTTNYTIPYPEITDFVKDGATAMENIAERVDDVLFAQVANRNLLYNGAMQIHQRGTSASGVTTGAFYTADRFFFDMSSLGTWTQTIENDAPTGSGFRKSLKTNCTTADASPAANDYHICVQRLEGQDLQGIRKGTSSAKTLTLSFWVKSNRTGTYVAELYDVDNSRQVSKSYTINVSGTWEYKTLTFPADTTGAFDNDNARSLDVIWWLGAGSTFTSGTLNTSAWASITQANRAAGQVNLAGATSNYWQVTGTSLTIGSADVPFEFKSYERDLVECQRFCQVLSYSNGLGVGVGQNNTSNGSNFVIEFPTVFRATPSGTIAGLLAGLDSGGIGRGFGSSSFNSLTPTNAGIGAAAGFNFTAGHACYIYAQAVGYVLTLAAELL